MDLQDLNKVWEIRALKKAGEDKARRILDRIAKQVQPIMRRRKWRVKVLSEFCPSNPVLLGLNVGSGAAVKLRLRWPNRDCDFIPFEQVLDTMLHELCHIEHGPHNAQFYKLWDELHVECEKLISKGITSTGEGFDAPGKCLGGFTRQPPLSSLQQTAVAAAAKRARVGALLPSGPRRLGGDNAIMTSLTPVQAAAMAAERRMQDDLWCGSASHEILSAIESENGELEHFISKDSGESSKNVDVSQGKHCVPADVCSDICQSNLHSGLQNIPSSAVKRTGALISCGLSLHGGMDDAKDMVTWECGVCTLLNQALSLVCELCGTQKPKPAGAKFKTWSCKFCTLENDGKLEKCSACDRWRYSYGPPTSSCAPNYGT